MDHIIQKEIFNSEAWSEDTLSDNATGNAIRSLLEELRAQYTNRFIFLHVVEPTEQNYFLSVFSKLIEDRGNGFGFMQSYSEFYMTYLKGLSKVF